MSVENPRHFKWYPTEEIDLGAMPFEGDFTASDRIFVMTPNGIGNYYIYNSNTNEFGRYVAKKVGPMEIGGVNYPVWIVYCGDGVCALKVPNAELEEVTTT